jgi:hypothetical protein
LLAAGAAGATDPAAPVPVPSGQTITWIDTIHDAPGPEGLTIRFRFLAPAIARNGGTIGPEIAADDMLALCRDYVLPRLPVTGPVPAQVIVSLADRPVEFGAPDPEATQFFEAYSIADGDCVVEFF